MQFPGPTRQKLLAATVDAVNGPDTLDKHVESVRQVALADHIVITKLDLVDAAQAKAAEAALTARLRRLSPAATISRVDDPAFNIGALLRAPAADPTDAKADLRAWLSAAAYEQHGGHEHAPDDHHDHNQGLHDRDIASFCFVREKPIPREALRLLLTLPRSPSAPP